MKNNTHTQNRPLHEAWKLAGTLVMLALPASIHAQVYGEAVKPEKQAPIVIRVIKAPQAPGAQASADKAPKETSPATSPAPATATPETSDTTSRTYTLHRGAVINQELSDWAAKTGWKVEWLLDVAWIVPNDTVFTGDFKSVASAAITSLANNGIVIRAEFYDGNKTLVITGASVAEHE